MVPPAAQDLSAEPRPQLKQHVALGYCGQSSWLLLPGFFGAWLMDHDGPCRVFCISIFQKAKQKRSPLLAKVAQAFVRAEFSPWSCDCDIEIIESIIELIATNGWLRQGGGGGVAH